MQESETSQLEWSHGLPIQRAYPEESVRALLAARVYRLALRGWARFYNEADPIMAICALSQPRCADVGTIFHGPHWPLPQQFAAIHSIAED
jgi:hypothetical protein